MKSIYLFALGFLFLTGSLFAQDTLPNKSPDSIQYKYLQKVDVTRHKSAFTHEPDKVKTHIRYRPTRLGSSSPFYDTYRKNKKGAGAVTTNPNKGGSSFIYQEEYRESIYDTLLNRGDSSAIKQNRED